MVITVESFSSARGCEQLSATITDPFFVSAANVRPYAGDLISKILFFQFESNNNNDKNLLKRDRDLLILVLAEVIIYIITSSPFSIISIEMMITQFMFSVKSLPLIQAEVFGMNVAILAIFIFSGISFYTYIVVSRSFRQDFKHLIRNNYRRLQGLPLDPSISRTNR